MSERRPASQPSLFDRVDGVEPRPTDNGQRSAVSGERPAVSDDEQARRFAVDPRNHVVLEASAGTGKTSVLVARYINLLGAGVDPANILAITFTRKAAAEMRERIVHELAGAAGRSAFDRARWLELRDRLGDIAISTIDAFCLSLLREFPLEADLDPGFDLADETEVPRLVDDALDRAMRLFTARARHEPDLALVLAQLGTARTREGLASLLERRLVAWDALDRFLARGPAGLTGEAVCRRAATRLQDALRAVPGGLAAFLADGPSGHPRYQMLVRGLERLPELERAGDAELRTLVDRVAAHFLTAEGQPRKGGALPPYRADHYPSADASRRHRAAVVQIAPHIQDVVGAFGRDLNVVLARGIRRMFAIALSQYRAALDERSVLDFSDVLQRAIDLLRQMDEFSQSRFRLEARYHHVLVDEFQDTSRAQWELVSLLVAAWGEGLGLPTAPSIFIVGDRKQSIYRFRDAEVAVLRDAARHIEALRPGGSPRRSISRSFRSRPEILEFVNELFAEMSESGQGGAARADDFTYGDADRFPTAAGPGEAPPSPVLGLAVAAEPDGAAAAVADEIERILRDETVRDRQTGIARQARPGDIAILFRSRTTHREFQAALEARGIPAYVYKGLGFFDADEIKDLSALLRYLASPASDLRAAAFMRSRFVRLSDRALALLAPSLAAALTDASMPAAAARLDGEDRRVLEHVRARLGFWIRRVDAMPPADLVEQLLPETAYAFELAGPRLRQAWENVKKLRGLVRRIQNRGYATLSRIADHIDALATGDDANAVLEALDAVNLMTIHAAKGLEFPVVFVVNLARGATGPPRPVRVVAGGDGEEPSVSIGPFVSETDEMEREREKHETRRLLYVALTRARDRLYLSSLLKDGVVQPGRGSLAEILPESIRELLGRAASAFEAFGTLAWTGRSGRQFDWRVCRPPAEDQAAPASRAPEPSLPSADDLGPLDAGGPSFLPVTEWLDPGTDATPDSGEGGDRIAGTIVHRLFQAWASADVEEAGAGAADRWLRPDERAALDDPDRVVARAFAAWQAMRGEVERVADGGQPLFEVPFSLRVEESHRPPIVLRGTIDCLVRRRDGSVRVIELKTGRRRAAHRAQLEVYVRAARALFPGAAVDGVLVYPS